MKDTVGLEIVVNDKGSLVVKNFRGVVGTAMTGIASSSKEAGGAVTKLWQSMALGQAAFAIVAAGARKVKDEFKATANEALTFEEKFANVTTILDGTSAVTEKMRSEILALAGPLGSATELTEGLYNALSSGVAPGEAVKFIGDSAKFSRAALAGMYDTVDVLTSILNAYGLKASEVTDISDVLFQVIKDGKLTGQQLAGALGSVIPTAAAMGVNIREVGAAIAIMTQGGIGADAAVTALNQTLLSALSPTKEAEDMAKSLGIEMSKAGIQGAGGLQKWLGMLKEKIGDNTEAMNVLFPNVRALKAALSLAGEQSGKYAAEMEKMADVSGVTEEAFKKQELTLRATATAIKNEVVAALITTFLPALKSIREWVETNREEIKKFAAGMVSGIGSMIGMLGSVIGWLAKSKDALIAMGAAMAVVKIQAWYGALNIAGSSIMLIVQRAQMLKAVGVGSVAAFAQSINYSLGATTTLAGALKNLPAVGMAAFAGWKIGEFINNTLGAGKAVQWLVDKMSFPQSWYDNLSASQRGLTQHSIEGAKASATIRELGTQLGVNSGSLRANAVAVLADKDAFSKLPPEIQAIVSKLALVPQSVDDTKNSLSAMALVLVGMNPLLTSMGVALDAAFASGVMNKAMRDREEQLKAQAEAAKKARAEFEAMASSLGLLSAAGMKDVDTQTRNLVKSITDYGDQLNLNKGIQQQFWDEAVGLANKYIQTGRQVPQGLQDIIDKYRSMITLQNSMRDLKIDLPDGKIISDSWSGTLNQIDAELKNYFDNIDNAKPKTDAFGNVIKDASDKTKKWEINWKDANEVMQFAQSMVSGVTDLLGAMGIELGSSGEAALQAASGIGQLWAGIESGNPMAIIQGVTQAVAGLLKLFKGDGVGEAIERENKWMDLTKQQIEQIRELETQYGSTHAATSELLDQFISSADITTDSFDQWANRMRGILSDLDQGKMTMAETQREIGDAFTALISKAKELGTEGSASLTAFYKDLANRGIQVAEVQQYINDSLEAGTDAYADLKDSIEGSAAMQEIFGNISVGVYDDIIAYRDLLAKNEDLAANIGRATEAMTKLANAGEMNEMYFDQFSLSAAKSFDALIAGGMDSSQAIKAMKPNLQELQFLHEQYGYTIDANTQAILDQAIAEGTVIENKKTEQQQIIDLLGVIARQLGADIPDALGQTAAAAHNAFIGAYDEVHKLNAELDGLSVGRNISISTKAQGDYVSAAGGYYNDRLSQDTVIQAHKGEKAVIIPADQNLSQVQGGGSRRLEVYMYIQGEASPYQVARAMNTAIDGNVDGITSKLLELQ